MSFSSSVDWHRGLTRLALHTVRFLQTAEGQRHRVFWAMVTSPSSDASPYERSSKDSLWTTATRAFRFNEVLKEVALEFDIPLIDMFWPTVNRFDGRTDNCHFCDYVATELAVPAFRALLPSNTIG